MMRRLARPYAIAGLLAAIVGGVGAIGLRLADPVPVIPNRFGFGDLALVGFAFLGLTFASVGALLVERRPQNAVGWCMVLIGAAYAVGVLFAAMTFSAVADGPDGAATARLTAWLALLFTTIGGVIFGLGLIFPTGRGHTPAWDRMVRLLIVGGMLFLAFLLTQPRGLHLFPTIDNPFGIGPDLVPVLGFQLSPLGSASAGLFAPLLVASLISRYRISDSVGRQQLKWFGLALSVTLAGVAVAGIGGYISDEPSEAGLVVFGFAGALIPVAIGIAILRYHLYDIDRIISRTLSYAAITAVLAGVFGLVALSLGIVLGSFAEGQTIAVAGSTLLVVALFGPLRRRAQTIVDRRFDRSSYDASRTVEAMTGRLRDDVDLDRVEADVLGVLERTFHPATASVWIRGGSR
jgi:hypothetical protein